MYTFSSSKRLYLFSNIDPTMLCIPVSLSVSKSFPFPEGSAHRYVSPMLPGAWRALLRYYRTSTHDMLGLWSCSRCLEALLPSHGTLSPPAVCLSLMWAFVPILSVLCCNREATRGSGTFYTLYGTFYAPYRHRSVAG